MKLTTIIETSHALSTETRKQCPVFKGDDLRWYLSSDLEIEFGIIYHTLWRRIRKFGLGSPKILSRKHLKLGHIPVIEEEKEEKVYYIELDEPKIKRKEFSRSLCKRDKTLCENYKTCMDMRLGLIKGLFIEPDNTDICFKWPRRVTYGLYHCALSTVYTT